MEKKEKNCHNCYNAKFQIDYHGNKYGAECMRTGMRFFASVHRGCKIAITDKDIAEAKKEIELNKEVFEITLEAYKKSADCYIAEWEAIIQRLISPNQDLEATPEERAGMSRNKQDEPTSVDELKNSSTYKCALPEEREAMLERHYELEIAELKEKNRIQALHVKTVEGYCKEQDKAVSRLYSEADILTKEKELCNDKLAISNDKLAEMRKIFDNHARKNLDSRAKQQCGDCQVLLQQLAEMRRERSILHDESQSKIESKDSEIEGLRRAVEDLKAYNSKLQEKYDHLVNKSLERGTKHLEVVERFDKLHEQVCGKWRLLEDEESIQGEDEIARWCKHGFTGWVPVDRLDPLLREKLLGGKQVVRRKITL